MLAEVREWRQEGAERLDGAEVAVEWCMRQKCMLDMKGMMEMRMRTERRKIARMVGRVRAGTRDVGTPRMVVVECHRWCHSMCSHSE
jgi:hypothetical protein